MDAQRYSFNEQTGCEEVGFYDEDGTKYAVVSRRRAIARGGPMRVYECLHLVTNNNDDSALMTAALLLLKHHDEEEG